MQGKLPTPPEDWIEENDSEEISDEGKSKNSKDTKKLSKGGQKSIDPQTS